MEKLFEGEYRLMEVLWDHGTVQSAKLVTLCGEKLGWNKSTTYTVLRKLKHKGAVRHEEGERAKQFYPAVSREDTALEETRGFLNRVYSGSLGLMVDAMVNSRSLSDREIEELKEILKKAEEGRNG